MWRRFETNTQPSIDWHHCEWIGRNEQESKENRKENYTSRCFHPLDMNTECCRLSIWTFIDVCVYEKQYLLVSFFSWEISIFECRFSKYFVPLAFSNGQLSKRNSTRIIYLPLTFANFVYNSLVLSFHPVTRLENVWQL